MMRQRLFAAVLSAMLLPACATAKQERPQDDLVDRGRSAPAPTDHKHKLDGGASWYGERFHGRKTACGEPFNMHALTAAHRSLPFHSVVRVTDPETRKSVVVRINDRGPYGRGRVIDLSWAAAKDLDMIKRGVIPVQIKVLSWGDGGRCR